MCLLDVSGCRVHSGGPSKRKMNSSGRVMCPNRLDLTNELITRQDQGRRLRGRDKGEQQQRED